MLTSLKKDKICLTKINNYIKCVRHCYSNQTNPKLEYQIQDVISVNPDPNGQLKTTFVAIFQKVVHKLGSAHRPVVHTVPYRPAPGTVAPAAGVIPKGRRAVGHGPLWRSTLTLKWPRPMTFEARSAKKVVAERANVRAALFKLKELGALDDKDQPTLNSGTILESHSATMAELNPPSAVWIESGLASKVDFVAEEYKRLAEVIGEQEYLHYPSFRSTAAAQKDSDGEARDNHHSSILNDADDLEITKLTDIYPDHATRTDKIAPPMIKNIITGHVLISLDDRRRETINARLFDHWQTVQNCHVTKENAAMAKIMEARDSLPIARKREEILETVSRAGVVIIAGDTGSGKSTQVPQYVREAMVEAGLATDCSVVVTQPRRISALSLAERVAHEMGQSASGSRFETEDRTGGERTESSSRPGWLHTGFHVRLFQRLPQRQHEGPILFCTPGILLRKLQQNPDLEGISHVIVDEVHEHDVLTDFLLAVLKRIQVRNPKLRVILMSATINTENFSRYFNDCAIINVKGRMFPIQSYYLPEVCNLIGLPQPQTSTIGSSKLVGQGTTGAEQIADAPLTAPKFDTKLLVQTITHIHTNEPPGGAILVFLPGWSEIKKVKDELESYNYKQRKQGRNGFNQNPMHLLAVHSSLSQDEQSRIFEPSRNRGRKVILSTNITETAVTINDVVYVVDSGLAKENKYNTETGVSYLDTIWASKSNIKQRRGRAGRVQEGKSYHLFTREFYDTLPDNPVPEILRIPLESIVLEAKLFATPTFDGTNSTTPHPTLTAFGAKAADFLSSLIVPPTEDSIEAALSVLRDELGFLDQDENLTHLGHRLVHVTCHPRLSLAMAWAAFFRCPGPIISLAAAMSHNRSLLLNKRDNHDNYSRNNTYESSSTLKDIKKKYAPAPGSDHLAHVRIYEMWRQSFEMGRDYRMLFEEENGIDWRNARFIDGIRSQLASELVSSRLVERADVQNPTSPAPKFGSQTSPSTSPPDYKLLRAILGASFYPNVAKVIYGDVRKGHFVKDARKLVSAGSQNRQGIIVPSTDSLCSEKDHYDTDWVTFLSVLKLPYRHNASVCRDLSTFSPIALALFAGRSLEHFEIPKDPDHQPEMSAEGTAPPQAKPSCDDPTYVKFKRDERTLLRLDGEPMLTLATRDTPTADRLIKMRHVISGLFGHFLKVGTVANSDLVDYDAPSQNDDDSSNTRVMQLRKEVIALCRKLIQTNH